MKMAGINAASITVFLFFFMCIFGFEGSVELSSATFVIALITGILTYKTISSLDTKTGKIENKGYT